MLSCLTFSKACRSTSVEGKPNKTASPATKNQHNTCKLHIQSNYIHVYIYMYKHLVSNHNITLHRYTSNWFIIILKYSIFTNKISTLSFFQVIKRACFDEGFPPTLVGTTAGGGLHRATAPTVRLTHQSCPPCFHSISV